MLVRSTVLFLTCVLLGCGAYAQVRPGGKGELHLNSPRWVDPKTKKTVKIGSITILYDYSTLLQEPIEKYNMKWERAQSAGGNSASGVEPTSIYNIRFRARVTSETGIGTGATIDFTPDIVPEAGAGFARLAIGGSPSWGKMFREEGSETYLSAERAKEIFRNRFQLADARIIQLGAGLKDHDEEAKKLAELERKKEELKKKSEELDALRQQVAESDASGEEEIDSTIKQARLSVIERERELKSEEGRLRAQEAEQRKMAEAEKLARENSAKKDDMVAKRDIGSQKAKKNPAPNSGLTLYTTPVSAKYRGSNTPEDMSFSVYFRKFEEDGTLEVEWSQLIEIDGLNLKLLHEAKRVASVSGGPNGRKRVQWDSKFNSAYFEGSKWIRKEGTLTYEYEYDSAEDVWVRVGDISIGDSRFDDLLNRYVPNRLTRH